MESLEQALQRIEPVRQEFGQAAKRRWDSIAKPLGSLGLLEDAVVRIAGIQRRVDCGISRRAVTIFCADNGIVEEGVTQCGSEVTAVVAENFTKGDSCVCIMAELANAEIVPVDIGMNIDVPGMVRAKVRYGTENFLKEPAMSRQEVVKTVEEGIYLAEKLAEKGIQLIATGEMGIGNTTTSSAVAAVLTGRPVEEMTGRGAGLSDAGLKRKIEVIKQALEQHQPDPADVIGVLSAVGGLDIAGLAGMFLGCARRHIPVMVDGFISSVAALCAVRLCPAVQGYLLASHCSEEPAGELLLNELGLTPLIRAGMRLGEGTGAVAAIPLLDMAIEVYRKMSTFEEIEIEAYQPL